MGKNVNIKNKKGLQEKGSQIKQKNDRSCEKNQNFQKEKMTKTQQKNGKKKRKM